MNGRFRLESLQDECEGIIDAPGICLQTDRTGEHYLLAGVHTDRYYQMSSAVSTGSNRELFARLLIEKSDGRIRLADVRAIVVTTQDAGMLAGTLQHFRDFPEDVPITYTYERNGILALRDESIFVQDEGVLIVHAVAASFNGVERAIRLVQNLPVQPYVVGFFVLLDRSPIGSNWKRRFISFPHVVGIERPIEVYSSDDGECSLCCMDGLTVRDVREAA